MIGKLTGIIAEIKNDYLIVDISGVGYIVFCSNKILSTCEIGQSISLLTQTIIKEHEMNIYGFISSRDKELFNHLLSIQGVGAKLAQVIIGSNVDILQSIQNNDVTILTKIPGVGVKLATRLINELKNKNLYIIQEQSPLSNTMKDAYSALLNLGYSDTQINNCLKNIQSQDLEEIIKEALKLLSKK